MIYLYIFIYLLNLIFRYQQMLHRNLVYLASIADVNQNLQTLLPVSKILD
jgi:hypothetical protein